MAWNYSNNSVQTTLSPGIDGVVGSITVGSITGFPVVYPYTLILDYGAANREVVSVTAGTGTTLTVTRGQDGTAAVAHSANAVVVHGVVARDLAEPQAHIPVAQAHIAAGTNVHGLAGGAAVVGTTTAQTLSNKTLDNTSAITVKDNVFTLQDDVDPTKQAVFQLASITTGTTRTYTFPNTAGALVTATGAQTLDAKTLTNVPSIGITGVGKTLYVEKPATTARGSTITRTADPDLTIALDASSTWQYEFLLWLTSTVDNAGHFAFDVIHPANSQTTVGVAGLSTALTSGTSGQFGAGAVWADTATTTGTFQIGCGQFTTLLTVKGRINMGVTAGNLTLSWAQFTSNANVTNVLANSSLFARRVI